MPPKKVLGPTQTNTVDDAIRAVTMDAAYPIFAENKIGSLEVGKQADFVVLEKIHAQPQLQIFGMLRSNKSG